MIQAQTIVDKVKADVDAEGSDYYTFDQDYAPAINKAIDWCVSVVSMAFAAKRISEEAFQDLMRTRVFQTNTFSRIMLPGATQPDDIWNMLAVLPLPITYPNSSITPTVNPVQSFFRGDLSFISSTNSAKRLTGEEWEQNKNNPLESGHSLEPGETARSFAYLGPDDYNGTSYVTTSYEIEIRPAIPSQLCAIRYVKNPTKVALITDNIEFPTSMEGIIYSKVLNFISYKQGDQTNIYQDSAADLKLLLSAFM